MSVQVPKGYQQTEVGVIPEDWNNFSIGDLISFQGGSQPDKSFFSYSKKSGYIRLIQIRDYKTDKFEVFVPKNLVRRFCDENDIMIGRYGPPVFQILRGISGAYNVALIKATPSELINKEYACYYLKQDSLFNFIDKLSQRSSGQTGVDLKELRAYPFVFPAQASEQAAIVEALSDADALIESLEQLIAKKRQIKQGAMQELLTGQRRLPGFSGEWVRRKLGEICSMKSGFSITSDEIDEFSEYPCYGGNGSRGFTSTKTHSGKYALIGRQGALCGNVVLVDGDFFASEHAIVVTPNVNLDIVWFSYILERMNLNQYSESSAQPGLSASKLLLLEAIFPPKDEQIEIAKFLLAIEEEIRSLINRLEKARKIKQAMMQELLTGRIRLI